MRDSFKVAWPEVRQRLLYPIVLFGIALVGLWLGSGNWQFLESALLTCAAGLLLWMLDPFFVVVLERSEEVEEDGDVA